MSVNKKSKSTLDVPKNLTVAQAVQILQLPPRAVINLCRHGQLLNAKRKGDDWSIPWTSIEEFSSSQQQQSVPVKAITETKIPKKPSEKKYELSESTPHTKWEHFRNRPVIFWPSLILGGLATIIVFLFAAISAGADLGPFQNQMYEWGLFRPFPSRQGDEILIVIATFYTGDENRQSTIQDEIRAHIQEQVTNFELSNLRVEIDPTIISVEDRVAAEIIGKRHDATVVIWGSDTNFRVATSFLNIAPLEIDPFDNVILNPEQNRTYLSNPSAYVSFVTDELTPQLTFLALYAMGKAVANNGSSGIADQIISYALNNFGDKMEPHFHKNIALIWMDISAAQFKNHAFEDALISLDKALSFDSNNEQIYIGQAIANFNLKQYSRAIYNLTQATILDPETELSYLLRAYLYIETGSFEQAVSDANYLLVLDSQNEVGYFLRSWAYTELKLYEEAIGDLNTSIEINPQYAPAFNNRGWTLLEMGNYDQAIQDLNEAIAIDPEYATAYNNRGWAYIQLGNYNQAIIELNRAIHLDSQDSVFYSNRGWAYTELNQFNLALRDLNQAIALESKFDIDYSRRGYVFIELGEFDKAIDDYNHVIELNKADSSDYNNLGFVHIRKGNYELAIEYLNKALTLESTSAAIHSNLGSAYSKQGLYDLALIHLNNAISLDSTMANPYSHRGFVFFKLNLYEQALSELDQAIFLDPSYAQSYKTRGLVNVELGLLPQARMDFQKYLELDIDSLERIEIEQQLQEIEVQLKNWVVVEE